MLNFTLLAAIFRLPDHDQGACRSADQPIEPSRRVQLSKWNHDSDWQDGIATLQVDLTHDHLNPLGLVHGGLYASMLDVALAMSGSYRPAPEGLYPGLTLSLTTQYIGPLQLDDGFALAKARRTGGGKSVFFAEGEVLAPDGRVIASASGVFKPGRPLKG